MDQICVPVLRNALGDDLGDGYRLLRSIRAYVELDLLASFDVHTDRTIERSRTVAAKFSKLANISRLFSLTQNNVTIAHTLKFPGVQAGGLELSQSTSHPAPF
jgi:hypothetical protein